MSNSNSKKSYLSIKLASPETIRKWSHGEVKKIRNH